MNGSRRAAPGYPRGKSIMPQKLRSSEALFLKKGFAIFWKIDKREVVVSVDRFSLTFLVV